MFKRMMMSLLAMSLLAGLCNAETTQSTQADQKVIAEVLGQKITQADQSQLQELIIKPLFDKYVKDKGLEPTEVELETFVKHSDDRDRERLAKDEKQKKELLAELTTKTLSDDQRAQKKKHLEVVEWLISYDEKRKKEEAAFNDHATDEQIKERRNLRHQSKLKGARLFVQNWKLFQSLYQNYGGRIAGDKFGPVPIDALMSFVKEEKKKGNFAIFDPELEKAFWEKLSYNSKSLERLVFDKETGDRYMSQPWWTIDQPIEP